LFFLNAHSVLKYWDDNIESDWDRRETGLNVWFSPCFTPSVCKH